MHTIIVITLSLSLPVILKMSNCAQYCAQQKWHSHSGGYYILGETNFSSFYRVYQQLQQEKMPLPYANTCCVKKGLMVEVEIINSFSKES